MHFSKIVRRLMVFAGLYQATVLNIYRIYTIILKVVLRQA